MSSPSDNTQAGRAAAADARREDIAIIGMACRFPGAPDHDTLWERLSAEADGGGVGAPAVAPDGTVSPRGVLDDVGAFDAAFFGISPREAALMDPQQRLFLECAFEALETAGKVLAIGGAKVGVFAGCGLNTYLIDQVLPSERVRGRGFPETTRELQVLLANAAASMPMRVSYALNLTGPSVNVQAACATGLVAVHAARLSLLAGECDMALAGAAAVRIPPHSAYRPEPGMILSRDGACRAFDHAATGTVYGDGVGVVLLKRLHDARRDGDPVHAVLRGSAVNNDGSARLGFAAPSVDGQAAVISAALRAADVDPCSVAYVEAHGTGTPLGDPVEIAALALAYGAASPAGFGPLGGGRAIGSVKTRIGHCAEAAGIAGLIVAVLALKNRTLPATANFTAPNPHIDFDAARFLVNTERRPWEQIGSRRAGVSAFGMGGTNAHAILEEHAAPTAAPACTGESFPQILPISARSSAGLRTLARRLRRHLCANRVARLEDICFSAAVLRRTHSWRKAIVAASPRELRAKLRAIDSAVPAHVAAAQRPPKVAFLFAGPAFCVAGSGRELHAREPVFREAVDRCEEIVRNLGLPEITPRSALLGAPLAARNGAAHAQVAAFTLGYGLWRMWLDWGVKPFALLGHGLGEYTAACAAKVFEPEAALRLVIDRALCVPSVAPERPDLKAAIDWARLREAEIPLVSSRSGAVVGAEFADPDYWSVRARRPILFREGLATVAAMGADVFLDLGAGGRLAALAQRCIPDRAGDILATLPRTRGDAAEALWSVSQALAALFERGAHVDWSSFHRTRSGRPCHLPPTPFEPAMHWCGTPDQSALPRHKNSATRDHPADAPPAAAVDLAALKAALTSDEARRYARSIAALDRQVPTLIVSALRDLGVHVAAGCPLPLESFVSQAPPGRRRWIMRLIAMLEEEGLVRRSDGGMCWTGRTCRSSDARRFEDDSCIRAEAALVRRVGDRLAALIAGEADPLATMFPDGTEALVARFYKTAVPLRALNEAVAGLVAGLAAQVENRPLQLLEIGAGTLATTRIILERCPEGGLDYDVTDVGRSILADARRALGHRKDVRVRRLDIERPGAMQGIAPGSYDVIVAANVLHATIDLSRSLRHVRELLRPGGTLVAVEGTAQVRWIDLTFGALSGWWRFEDSDARRSHPLLGAKAWADLLVRSGFVDPVVLDTMELSPAASALPQALIVAGTASQQAPAPALGGWRLESPVVRVHPTHSVDAGWRGADGSLVANIACAVAEMLGHAPEDVATNRSFEVLGLDSLAMLELRTDLERRIARPISFESIPADLSIEALAAAIAPSGAVPARRDATPAGTTALECRILSLNGATAGRPLVCLPAIVGDLAPLRPLARRLEDTVTVFGMDLPPDPASESIPARAARAVRALGERWPNGGHQLIGHSFGGLLAYEIARQLEASDRQVDLLAIVDIQADAPISLAEKIPEPAECRATVAALIARARSEPVQLPPEGRTAAHIADGLAASGIPVDAAHLEKLATRYRANRCALAAYRPTPSRDLPIVLLRAAARHPADGFLPDAAHSAADPSWGWQNLTSAPVATVLLPGNHVTMMTEPHVEVLAGNLALHLA